MGNKNKTKMSKSKNYTNDDIKGILDAKNGTFPYPLWFNDGNPNATVGDLDNPDCDLPLLAGHWQPLSYSQPLDGWFRVVSRYVGKQSKAWHVQLWQRQGLCSSAIRQILAGEPLSTESYTFLLTGLTPRIAIDAPGLQYDNPDAADLQRFVDTISEARDIMRNSLNLENAAKLVAALNVA